LVIKLTTKIKNWIEKESKNTHPLLTIKEQKPLKKGHYYDFETPGFRFCLILQDLKLNTKINWVFYRHFTQDESDYWRGRYEFKLKDEEGKYYTRSTLQIDEVENHEIVKVIMNRQIDTLRIFKKDLRWIILMGKKGDAE
jgi:hypothetical protein